MALSCAPTTVVMPMAWRNQVLYEALRSAKHFGQISPVRCWSMLPQKKSGQGRFDPATCARDIARRFFTGTHLLALSRFNIVRRSSETVSHSMPASATLHAGNASSLAGPLAGNIAA